MRVRMKEDAVPGFGYVSEAAEGDRNVIADAADINDNTFGFFALYDALQGSDHILKSSDKGAEAQRRNV